MSARVLRLTWAVPACSKCECSVAKNKLKNIRITTHNRLFFEKSQAVFEKETALRKK